NRGAVRSGSDRTNSPANCGSKVTQVLVPRSKLMVWVALVVLPFSVLGAVEPAATALALGAILALGLLAILDAMRARNSLAGISVKLPEVVRLSKDREGKLEVRIRNEPQTPKVLRLALGLPPEIDTEDEAVDLALPESNEWSRLSWSC